MNYAKIYGNIIKKAKSENRQKGQGIYYENHHILPKCLGGNDNEDNLILLRAKEHYICHKLLTKIYPTERGLFFALHYMIHGRQRKYLRLSSFEYGEIRSNMKHSEKTKMKMSKIAKNRKVSDETRKILSESHKGISPSNKGKKMGPRSEEIKQQISEKLKGRKKNKESVRKGAETRRKNGQYDSENTSMYGKKHSPETLEKMRQARLGKPGALTGRKRINKNGVMKYVSIEELPKYESDGWVYKQR